MYRTYSVANPAARSRTIPKPAVHGNTERRHHQWPRLAVGNVAMLDTAYLALVWLVVS
jgi:hypothetical protein